RDPGSGQPSSVFALASGGQLLCLGPNTGRVFWTANVAEAAKVDAAWLWSSPALDVRRDARGLTRRVVFGAMLGPDLNSTAPAVLCYEDRVEADPAEEPV